MPAFLPYERDREIESETRCTLWTSSWNLLDLRDGWSRTKPVKPHAYLQHQHFEMGRKQRGRLQIAPFF